MTADAREPGTLRIELEDAATRSARASVAGLGAGVQQWHFVGLVGDEARYDSGTFTAPYSWGGLPMGKTVLPEEGWAPGMGAALDRLRSEISGDGWLDAGRGDQPWQYHYVQAATD
jgi:hypothetical protein